ncbi:hypothetical protein ACI6Q2_13775 [Chitinophagaceae bacterium LWZ2-11]
MNTKFCKDRIRELLDSCVTAIIKIKATMDIMRDMIQLSFIKFFTGR